ncbi:hypothetical protein GCM10009687_01520 [Asanoa iriomotensis]|uniref:Fido domain-containing protein n=1 Tax=Asanoa iriomotensis TaxID=234613 RepID=A0ABQ4CAI5_9ACTN|nr:hypothetical protein Air01nite_58900 [Asanoa iriomotensis]
MFIGTGGGRVTEARFVPPPPGDQLRAGVDAWAEWINQSDSYPLIIKMALGHYQFETLHPFNDGNGRLGRLVCVLQLARAKELRFPLLNLSPWLERRRREYQDHLLQCSVTGEFDAWIRFFSEAARAQATRAVAKIEALHDWRDHALALIRGSGASGRLISAITEDLIGYPLLTPKTAANRYDATYPGANKAIDRLVQLGILRERTGRRYGRVFAAPEVLRIIESD